MNFLQKTKRFLEPLNGSYIRYFWLPGLAVILTSATGYVQIYMIQTFLRHFSRGEIGAIPGLIAMIFIVTCICVLGGFILRNFSWIIPQFDMSKWMLRKYISRVLTGKNEYIEQIGTGRMIGILNSGITTWSTLINEATNNFFRWITLIILCSILLAEISSAYAIIFCVVFCIIVISILFFTRK
jgi:ABC-type multidrug transport system fused ATPase/permease subunit